MSNSRPVVLFNGVRFNDQAPGRVRRYRPLRSGAWKAGRILLYVFPSSFPSLWKPTSATHGVRDANDPGFRYRWTTWKSKVDRLPKDRGSWRELARFITGPTLDHHDVGDVAKAIIELTVRDAEIERFSYRATPSVINPFWASSAASATDQVREEQALMGRVRRAVTNNSKFIEKCIYQALASYDATVVQRIKQRAPADCAVHSLRLSF